MSQLKGADASVREYPYPAPAKSVVNPRISRVGTEAGDLITIRKYTTRDPHYHLGNFVVY